MKCSNAQSLLDIGAGSAATAIPLSRKVHRYVGIEENAIRAAALSGAGLDIIVGKFPLTVMSTFDMVLSSHSMPETGLGDYEPFCRSAGKLLNPGGLFVIVTFKGSRGDTAVLREEITGEKVGPDPQLASILNNLRTLGTVRVEKVNSHLQSRSAEDIIEWLTGALFRTDQERDAHSSRLKEILETRYSANRWITFPTEHLFISVSKKRSR